MMHDGIQISFYAPGLNFLYEFAWEIQVLLYQNKKMFDVLEVYKKRKPEWQLKLTTEFPPLYQTAGFSTI